VISDAIGRILGRFVFSKRAYLVCAALLLLLAGCDFPGQNSSAAPTAVSPTSAGATGGISLGSSEPPSAANSTPIQLNSQSTDLALTPTPTPTLLPAGQRLSIFNRVWDIVDHDYLYDDFHGVNWSELRTEYEPKAMQANTAQQFYDTISEMVGRLNDGHSRYLSPWDAREEDDFIHGHSNYTGIGVLSGPGNNSYTVMYVYPHSPAEQAGLKRRDHILAVDGRPLENAQNTDAGIRGPILTNVRLTVQSPGQAPRDIILQRQLVVGKVTASSHLLEADPTIGYLIVPTLFVNDMDQQVETELMNLHRKALLHDQPLRGLVIDLRGNGGGWVTVLRNVLGNFITGDAGTFHTNNSYVQNMLDVQHLTDFKITRGTL
jgi:C-terminal processing protease CtpA/Prc